MGNEWTLRECLKQHEVSQRELARRLGLNHSVIWNTVHGKRGAWVHEYLAMKVMFPELDIKTLVKKPKS